MPPTEIRLERLAREVVSKVATARKAAGLAVEDRIHLSLKTDSEEMAAAIAGHAELICAEVLATALVDLDIAHTDATIADEPLAIALVKCP